MVYPVISGLSQTPVVDSLKVVLQRSIKPEEQVDVLNALSYELYDSQDSVALEYAKQALKLANKIDYQEGEKYAYTLIGLGYYSKGEFALAFENLNRSTKIDVTDTNLQGYSFSILGNMHRDLANFDSARYYFDQALALGESTLSEKLRITLYKNLGELNVILWRNDEAKEWLIQAEQLAMRYADAYLLAEVYGHLGLLYAQMGEPAMSKVYNDKLCAMSDSSIYYFQKIKCLLRNIEYQYQRGHFIEGLDACLKANSLLDTYSYPPQVIEVYLATGNVYSELAQYDLALRYFFQALYLAEKLQLRRHIGDLYAQIAWVNKQQSNFALAFDYINRSIEIREAIGDKYGTATSYNYRGLIYYQTKRYTDALANFKIAQKLRSEIGYQAGVASAIFNISLVYEDLQEYDQAYNLLQEVIAIENKISNAAEVAITYNQMGNILSKMNRLSEAENYLRMASQLADESGSASIKRINYKYAALLCKARKNYNCAYENQVAFQQLSDSIYNRSVLNKLAEMEALYRVEQKEQQIRLLNQEREIQNNRLALQQSRIRSQSIIIASSLIGLALLSILVFNIYLYNRRIRRANTEILEQKEEIQTQAEELVDANEILLRLNREVTEKNEEIQAQSEELMEANQTIYEINKGLEEKVSERTNRLKEAYKELDTFFYRASHDFRRPLTTFMGLAEVARITVKDKTALELFEKVDETAHTLDRMLVKLQSISDVGAQQLVYKEVLISELINDILTDFREEIKSKNIKINNTVSLTDSFYSYPAMVKIALGNLIENAIQFNGPQNPTISISVEQEDAQVFLRVADNGQGIDAELHDKIFDMYFRGSDRSKGNGLGLYIAKKAVEKLGGTITVSSTVYKGSMFTVTLPLGNSNGL